MAERRVDAKRICMIRASNVTIKRCCSPCATSGEANTECDCFPPSIRTNVGNHSMAWTASAEQQSRP